MTESSVNNAVAAQAILELAPFLSNSNRWALLLNLACVNSSTYDLNCKDGALPPMLSDLPARQLSQQELQVYLIRHGIPIWDIQTFMEQLTFFAANTTSPDDRIVPLIIYTDFIPPYSSQDRFSMSDAEELDKTYLTIGDECLLLLHLLKNLYQTKNGRFTFFSPPFLRLPSPESYEDLSAALIQIKVNPDRVNMLIDDLRTLHEMKMPLFDTEDTIILAPPLAYEPWR